MYKTPVLLLLVSILPGCGLWEKLTGNSDEKGQEMWQAPAPPRVEPVPQDKLVTFIPKLPGWDGSAVGAASDQAGETVTSARGSFEREVDGKKQVVRIAIVDGTFSSEVFAPLTRLAHSRSGQPDLHKKGIELEGNPGIEEWRVETGGVTIALAVARRFFFQLDGEGVPPEAVGEWMKAVDLKALGALAGKPPVSGSAHEAQ